jgi:TrkA domain protein
MGDVTETRLPGVGVRHEFQTVAGERLGLVSHRTGRRELLLYDRHDPDAACAVVHLDSDDARTLAELLGASHVSESLASLQRVEGLAIDWLNVVAGSPAAGRSIKDAAPRSETGVSIVAVLRGDATLAAPGPDERLEAGDVAVVVGTAEGIARLHDLLRPA